jgi:hypothetical protein
MLQRSVTLTLRLRWVRPNESVNDPAESCAGKDSEAGENGLSGALRSGMSDRQGYQKVILDLIASYRGAGR